MENKKKKIILILIIITIIIAVIGVVSYNNSMQSEWEVNDIAREIFLSGEMINEITDIENMNLDSVEKWLNNKGVYPDGSVERLDYYEFYNTKTGEFLIVEKSTGIVSYSVHKDIIEKRAYLSDPLKYGEPSVTLPGEDGKNGTEDDETLTYEDLNLPGTGYGD